jgi:hypothetical protein
MQEGSETAEQKALVSGKLFSCQLDGGNLLLLDLIFEPARGCPSFSVMQEYVWSGSLKPFRLGVLCFFLDAETESLEETFSKSFGLIDRFCFRH